MMSLFRQWPFTIMIILLLMNNATQAQTAYEKELDPQHEGGLIIKGLINKYTLINEPTFTWYIQSQQSYQPDQALIAAFENARDKGFQFVLFGGAWCDDTQYILPRFFKILDQSGFSEGAVTFFGVDRFKKTIGNMATVFNISRVPVIIVMKDGKEKGRVVEYGTTGKWDLELLELIK
jgi:hypothetical protein